MLASYNWLKELVEIEESPEEIAHKLTMAGCEVEGIEHVGKELGEFLTASIVDISSHPSGGNLKLVRISLGDRNKIVVCAAPNIEVGQTVPYAPVGSVLADGTEILMREIKGIQSPGMLCSEKELGLGEDTSGILTLDARLSAGMPLNEALPFIEDHIFEIGITPNRGDCLSMLGIAREVAAITKRDLKIPETAEVEESDDTAKMIKIELPDPHLCPRYVARIVKDVQIRQSPLDVRLRLTRLGVRPISNVVDMTNLVLLECGQPLHAFDYDLLDKKTIVVKRAKKGDKFTTLDGEDRVMPKDALMIRDGKKPVALGGIMGGLNSEINDSTKVTLIESACFERFGIRRTAKALGMSTEASYRFERGVDPEGSYWAANRAALLMAEYCDAKIVPGIVDAYPEAITRPQIEVRLDRVNKALGVELDKEEVIGHFQSLGISVTDKEEGTLSCAPPSWRWDLENEIDYVEEAARLHGFNNIPISTPRYRSAPDNTRRHYKSVRDVAGKMASQGFSEIVTMSFVSKSQGLEFPWNSEPEDLLPLMNPLTEDMTVMRSSLMSGLISTMKRNLSFRSKDLRLFEIGKVFKTVANEELPDEELRIAGLATGRRNCNLWNVDRDEALDFYDLKAVIENLFQGGQESPLRFDRAKIGFLHPGKSAEIYLEDQVIGYIGELAPSKMREHDLEQNVQVFEILLEPVLLHALKQKVFRPIPRYPYMERDLSIIVEDKVSGDDIKRLISHLGHDIIHNVTIFDLYRGKSLPEGKQSFAFRIRYQSEERTLTDEEVQEVHSHVVEAMQEKLGATLRD